MKRKITVQGRPAETVAGPAGGEMRLDVWGERDGHVVLALRFDRAAVAMLVEALRSAAGGCREGDEVIGY